MTNPQPLEKALMVFGEVVQCEGGDRRRRMEELCGQDTTLRDAVGELLENDERAEHDGFLTSSPELVTDCLPKKTIIDDFELIRPIGSGGAGVVYEAEQISLDRRRVAVKVLSLIAANDRRAVQRFQNEARWAAKLQHRNIVPVFAVGEASGVLYYAMQFISGHDLAHLIERWRAETTGPDAQRMNTIAGLALQAAEGLEYAHDMGLIHRDIKPSNLLLDSSNNLWIADFGLARLRDREQVLTQTAGLLGTLPYMSPEQVSQGKRPLDRHTDIYSLGVTMYELMTQRLPFDQPDPAALLREIAEKEPKPPRSHCREIPQDLETITMKAMAKDAVDRYHSAEQLAEDLRRFIKGEPILGRPRSRRQMKKFIERKQRSVVETAIDMLDEWFNLHPTLTDAQRQFLESALVFYQDLCGDDHAEPDWLAKIADTYRRVGEIQRRLDRFEQAEQAYQRAVDLATSLVKEHPSELRLKKVLAHCHLAQGTLLSDTGRHDEAEKAFLSTLGLCQGPVRAPATEFGRDSWYGLAIAANLNLASMYECSQRTNKAEACYREAVALSQAMAEAAPSTDAGPLLWLTLSQYRLGFVLEVTDRYQEADGYYAEALEAAEEMASTVPEPGWGRALARALMHETETIASERGANERGVLPRPSIEPLYRGSVEILERLAAQWPLIPEFRVFLGTRRDRYGNMLVKADRLPEAEIQYRSAIATYETLLSEFPSLPEHRDRIAVSENHLADLLESLGRDEEAERSWQRAIQLRKQLAAHAPQILSHRRSLAETHLHFAKFLTSKGREAEADDHFRRARELD